MHAALPSNNLFIIIINISKNMKVWVIPHLEMAHTLEVQSTKVTANNVICVLQILVPHKQPIQQAHITSLLLWTRQNKDRCSRVLLNHILWFCTHSSFWLILKHQTPTKSVLISAICRCADSCLSTIVKICNHILNTLTNHCHSLHLLTYADHMCKFNVGGNV